MTLRPNSRVPKRFRRRVVSLPPVQKLVDWIERPHARGPDDLLVAMFHRTIDGQRFDEQLDALLRDRVAVSGADVARAFRGEQVLPQGAVWLTFDDGYGDFADLAWPVLRRRALPATQFVPTQYVGQQPATFWWERLGAAIDGTTLGELSIPAAGGGLRAMSLATPKARHRAHRGACHAVKGMEHQRAMATVEAWIDQLGAAPVANDVRVLRWDELRGCAAEGLEVGCHTHSHPMLDQVSKDEVVAEIARGQAVLQDRLGVTVPILAYPSGQYDDTVLCAAREAGIEVAVTTEPGTNRVSRSDPLRLRRVAVGPFADGNAVRLRIALGR